MLAAEVGAKITQHVRAIQARNEAQLIDCLGRWVSECDPVTLWTTDEHGIEYVVGLGHMFDPTHTIHVHARLGAN